MASPLALFKKAPALRPMINIGCLFDIQTGRYYKGRHGENILNGGLANFTGVAGLPNMFKTVISLFQAGSAMSRLACAIMAAHDSENTLSVKRIYDVFQQFPALANLDLEELERLVFTDATVYVGNEWFDALKEYSKAQRADTSNRITTPFWDAKTKQYVTIPRPTISFLDSLSGLVTDSVQTMYDKAGVGESGLNMVAMKSSSAKSQMIDQMTTVTATGGIYGLMTAHVGQEYQLDPYKPNIKKLKFLKGDLKLKKVPENFSFLTGNCWYCIGLTPLLDKDKLPEFPRNDDDDLKGDTDLVLVTLANLRGKSGPSGIPFDLVISQSEGVKVGLSEYFYIKGYDYYGISDPNGNQAKGKPNYVLDLLPNEVLSRKTIRGKIETNPALQRALTITAELCMMRNLWHHIDEELHCTPKQLYKDLVEQGYDWDILLNTVGYWRELDEHENSPTPFLSTMDLMEMRLGRYHPWWYPKSRAELQPAVALAA